MFRYPNLAAFLRLAFAFFFISVSFTTCLQAQTGLVNGSVSGAVTDTIGSVIPGANLTLSTPDRTIVRTVTTDESGAFSITGLPSGSYTLEITAPGFAPYRNQSIAVAVGRGLQVNAKLAPASTNQQVTVQADSEALDTSQSSPVTNIDRDRIEELPIPSRNYLSFTLLTPALGAANPALSVRGTAAATEGGFSAGGLRPSSNALNIDGVDDNDEYTGLSRTELSPEAISDFQVVNHGYAAESGGSAGGSVDVETRSGANVQHGDAFLFAQNGALNASPALELAPRKPDENRLRAGLSTGGALKKDKLFYYVAAEQEMARGEEASDFSPELATDIDGALAQAGPLGGLHVQQGFFPTTNEETEISGRIDRALNANGLMLRYALTNNRSVNDAFNIDDLTDLSSRGSAFYDDNSVSGSWGDSLSPRLINQLTFEVAQRRVALRTGSASGPGISVAGLATFGTPYAGNSRRYETHADFGDGVIRLRGKHLFQAGAAISHVALRAANLDGFGGLYVFPDLTALANGQPDFYIQSFGDPDTNFGEARFAAYLQDHWIPFKGLALDYGLRYEYNRLPALLPQHPVSLSPRFGFAWSPDKNWVVRGGFGVFFDRYLLSTINRIEEFNGVRSVQQIAEGPDAASLYGSGISFTALHTGIAPSIWEAQPGLTNPYSETASLGIERALPSKWTVNTEYRLVRGVEMGRTINSNLPLPQVLTLSNAASLGIPSPTAQQLGQPVFPPQRINPAYDAINQFQTEAGSNYNGVSVTVNRQFTEDFELMAGYTFSKTIDDASYDTEEPQNPYALGDERSLSLNDQRNRFVLSGLWVLGPDLDDPQDASKGDSENLFQKIVYGLEFAPIVSASSGFHDNPITGADSNREHIYPFAARPSGFSRNDIQSPPKVNFDLRILRMVPIWRGHLDIVAESFNLLNKQNVDLINPVFGSGSNAQAAFRDLIQVADPRKVQFSLDFEY
ncbi:MAG TPA: carboxypeptidase regulatory-like domain-containing protein [Terracidiphilus sp.]